MSFHFFIVVICRGITLCDHHIDLLPSPPDIDKSAVDRFPLHQAFSLQCRCILGRRNPVRVRNIVVAAIFDFMTVEDWGE